MATRKKKSTKVSTEDILKPEAEEDTAEDSPLELPVISLNKDPSLAASVFEKLTETNMSALSGGKRELYPRQEITLVLDGAECAPGVFCDEEGEYYDFEVTLRSLSSEDEISIFSETDITEDQVGGAFLMAKKAFYKLNGTRVTANQKPLLWECFGPKGRQLVMRGFAQLSAISPAALGKLMSGSPEDLLVEE